MVVGIEGVTTRGRADLLRRNAVCAAFFRSEAPRLARACRELSDRFLDGGRLLAFGLGAASTDAQHVSVEFVHPIIVGKRALPAMDVGAEFEARLPVLLRPNDAVMGFSFHGDGEAVARAVRLAEERGALAFALAGTAGAYPFALPDDDPFVCQEVFEILYHVLWETVHVYFEHREQGHDVGASSFLYPFLGKAEQRTESVDAEVERSMVRKVEEIDAMRTALAEREVESITLAAEAIARRLERGGKLLIFGNGGSATDANDLAIDFTTPPPGLAAVPAISLSAEPATISAIANDVGAEVIFSRQLIALGDSRDVAVGISTSGSSPNILAALSEARRRGMLTVGLAGSGGGRMVDEHVADETIVVHSDYVPRIQEAQASAYHVLRRCVDDVLGGRT